MMDEERMDSSQEEFSLTSELHDSDEQVIDDVSAEDEFISDEEDTYDDVTIAQSPYASLKEHFDAGIELSDDEIDRIADLAISYIRHLFAFFGEKHLSVDEFEGSEGELILDVSGGDLAVLIGRHGRTLEAVQSLLTSYLSNTLHFHYPVVVDIEGYKSRRRAKLQSLAHSAASRAKRQHGRASLPPMSAYERRIVHLALVDDPDITTHSEGEDFDRHVVVTYVKHA